VRESFRIWRRQMAYNLRAACWNNPVLFPLAVVSVALSVTLLVLVLR
jgi:hypothetical protein